MGTLCYHPCNPIIGTVCYHQCTRNMGTFCNHPRKIHAELTWAHYDTLSYIKHGHIVLTAMYTERGYILLPCAIFHMGTLCYHPPNT